MAALFDAESVVTHRKDGLNGSRRATVHRVCALLSRLYLSVLACVWAILAGGLHQALGYENAYGYPPAFESIGWAGLFSAPFVLGAIYLSGRSMLARVIRALAASAIVVVLYLMLFVAWMWDFRMIVGHITNGTFFNGFFLTFVLGPPVLTALAAVLLIAREAEVILRPEMRGLPKAAADVRRRSR